MTGNGTNVVAVTMSGTMTLSTTEGGPPNLPIGGTTANFQFTDTACSFSQAQDPSYSGLRLVVGLSTSLQVAGSPAVVGILAVTVAIEGFLGARQAAGATVTNGITMSFF
jgi:hypothetical protein